MAKDIADETEKVSINSPSGEGGGKCKVHRMTHKQSEGMVSINSPSGEGGGSWSMLVN